MLGVRVMALLGIVSDMVVVLGVDAGFEMASACAGIEALALGDLLVLLLLSFMLKSWA